MYTTNDTVFCLLESCIDDLESSRLIYYMYVFQMSGFKFNFKYKLNASGLSCRQLNDMLGEIVNENKVVVENGIIKLTNSGIFYYNNVILTANEWGRIDYIKSVLNVMSEKDLFFICITDMLVYDVLETYGVDGLIKQKERIKRSISALSSEYTDENFDTALKFIRTLKETL